MFFAEDGPKYGCKITTGYLREKQNVAIAEKKQTPFYPWYLHNRAQRKTQQQEQ